MDKDEIIAIHHALFMMFKLFKANGIVNENLRRYEQLNVFPFHRHKSKVDHRKAISILCIMYL